MMIVVCKYILWYVEPAKVLVIYVSALMEHILLLIGGRRVFKMFMRESVGMLIQKHILPSVSCTNNNIRSIPQYGKA